MREYEEKLKNMHSAGTRNWISQVARSWQVAKGGTCVKHAKELKSHASWSTTGQKVQFGNSVCSRLELRLSQVVRPSRQSALFCKT